MYKHSMQNRLFNVSEVNTLIFCHCFLNYCGHMALCINMMHTSLQLNRAEYLTQKLCFQRIGMLNDTLWSKGFHKLEYFILLWTIQHVLSRETVTESRAQTFTEGIKGTGVHETVLSFAKLDWLLIISIFNSPSFTFFLFYSWIWVEPFRIRGVVWSQFPLLWWDCKTSPVCGGLVWILKLYFTILSSNFCFFSYLFCRTDLHVLCMWLHLESYVSTVQMGAPHWKSCSLCFEKESCLAQKHCHCHCCLCQSPFITVIQSSPYTVSV